MTKEPTKEKKPVEKKVTTIKKSTVKDLEVGPDKQDKLKGGHVTSKNHSCDCLR